MADTEIELKLSLAPKDVARFRRDPLIHRSKTGRARSKSLLAVYFDTPQLSVRSNGAALRIRQEGSDRVQTLKLAKGGAGLQHRLEYNAPTDAELPDLSLIPDQDVHSELSAWLGDDALVPIFSTDIKRTIWDLELSGSEVELCCDEGWIESGGQRVPVCELELELKSGSVLSLLDYAGAIAERFAVHVETRSKAARGYALYDSLPPSPRKAKKLILEPSAPAWASLAALVEEGTSQLLANEAVIEDGQDSAGIHQARVAVRRMRAALSAYSEIVPEERRKPLQKGLGRMQRGLGPARDWDVFIENVLTPLSAADAPPKGLRSFLQRAFVARNLAYEKARKALKSERYSELQLALIRFSYLPEPSESEGLSTAQFAKRLLDARLDIVIDAAKGTPMVLEEEALHALRIDIKKLRYSLDFSISLFPKEEIQPWRRSTKRLQDCLGGLNDAVVHQGLVEAMDAPDRPVPNKLKKVIGRVLTERSDEGLEQLEQAWKEFDALTPFWQ